RRGQLSAIVRVRSSTPVDGQQCSQEIIPVSPQGPRRVRVTLEESHPTQARSATFEVTRALPLDATRREIYSGVGAPVVDWLWDGFNALVLSYGQADAGKTSLLLGRDPSPSCSSASAAEKRPAPAHSGAFSERRPGGLLEDILQSLFDRVLAARRGVVGGAGPDVVSGGAAAVPAGGAGDTFATAEERSPASRGGSENGYTQPTWSSTRESGNTSMSEVLNGSTTNEARRDILGAQGRSVLTTDNGKQYTIAFSAWDVFGKTVRDLFSRSSSSSGSTSSCNDKSRKNISSGGAGGGRGVGSTPRRRRRRGRSGSVDNAATNSIASSSRQQVAGENNVGPSSGTGVWSGPPGYPEGFETVQVSDLPTALALLNKARQRSKEQRTGNGGRGGGGTGKEGGGRRRSGGGGGAAGEMVCPAGHIFFRVVLYSAEEETVSTLHVVDLAGGWK
ncbi:unnamed protein product, partial [Sphacelaria rigidula]